MKIHYFIIIFIVACTDSSNGLTPANNENIHDSYGFFMDADVFNPTYEQVESMQKMNDGWRQSITLINNKVVLKASKTDFEKMNLTIQDYHYFENTIKRINNLSDSLKITLTSADLGSCFPAWQNLTSCQLKYMMENCSMENYNLQFNVTYEGFLSNKIPGIMFYMLHEEINSYNNSGVVIAPEIEDEMKSGFDKAKESLEKKCSESR